MKEVTLGSTGIKVNKNGFGALPIQRATKEEAKEMIDKGCKQLLNIAEKYEKTLSKINISDKIYEMEVEK